MPRINARPVKIASTTPPPIGPTGYADFSVSGISSEDLANGVCIIADKYQGGPQTVRAAMAIRYRKDAERFFAISEEPVYDLIQIDDYGKEIAGSLPVLSITSDIAIDEKAAGLIAAEFSAGRICIEYCIMGRTPATYTRELRLLADAIMSTEDETAHGYTLVIDNGDSSCKRRRHGQGNDSKMIASIADLIAREVPTTGFIYSSAGPGNTIIEALRRCRVPVGKRISQTAAIDGFSAMTTKEVRQNWKRAYSHMTTDLGHAWKYDRNGDGRPSLLDLTNDSAIMVDPRDRKKLRKKMKTSKTIDGLMAAIEAAQRVPDAENASLEKRTPTRINYKDASLLREMRARGAKSANLRSVIVGAIYRHDIQVPGRPELDDFQEVLEFALSDYITDITHQVANHYKKGAIPSYSALACILTMIDVAGGDAGQVLNAMQDQNACGPFAAAARRINGYTEVERTPAAITACVIQAWNAHAAGKDVERFMDGVIPPAIRKDETENTIPAPSNDNAPIANAA